MAANAPPPSPSDLREANRRFREFRQGRTAERLFVHPTGRPTERTGFCDWERSLPGAIWFWIKAIIMDLAFKLPWSGSKVWVLRRMGAKVGRSVYFAVGTWVDPNFPELLTIEDDVFFGMGAKVFTHECRVNEFRAGKVLVRRRAFIGGFALIGCGVEIGEDAVVAACTVADRDVPAGATLIQSPARIVRRPEKQDRKEEP